MAKAAKAKGYAYMALTDHTQNLAMTRGLTPERLEEERALVKRVNQKLAPFVVLLGTEMDILMDGQLDFPDEVLTTLDYVSVSIHTGFRQSSDVMTARINRAISNPLVNTLNHGFGARPGEPLSASGAGALKRACPDDVRGLVETCLELDQNHDLLARVRRVDEGADDRRVA